MFRSKCFSPTIWRTIHRSYRPLNNGSKLSYIRELSQQVDVVLGKTLLPWLPSIHSTWTRHLTTSPPPPTDEEKVQYLKELKGQLLYGQVLLLSAQQWNQRLLDEMPVETLAAPGSESNDEDYKRNVNDFLKKLEDASLKQAGRIKEINNELYMLMHKKQMDDAKVDLAAEVRQDLLQNKMNITKSKITNLDGLMMSQERGKRPSKEYSYTENTKIDLLSAKNDYLLEDSDFENATLETIPSPHSSRETLHNEPFRLIKKKDAIKIALNKWGSIEKIELEKKSKEKKDRIKWMSVSFKTFRKTSKRAFKKDQGRVVMTSLLMNSFNAIVKLLLYLKYGSTAMFTEFIHSCIDVLNSLAMVYARYKSVTPPDKRHPYGYMNYLYMITIFNGVSIFWMGAGMTFINGIFGLKNPQVIDLYSTLLSVVCLAGTGITDIIMLGMVVKQINLSAKKQNKSFLQYVKSAEDPQVNTLLLEDGAALMGVVICCAAHLGSYTMGMPVLDPIGSLVISGMLCRVALYLTQTSMNKLLGKSLHNEQQIKDFIEQDKCIEIAMDVKTLDFGDQSRLKAEVRLDNAHLTRTYLEDPDILHELYRNLRKYGLTEEQFKDELVKFGDNIYEEIVYDLDRMEDDIKRKFPNLRHIDLEPS